MAVKSDFHDFTAGLNNFISGGKMTMVDNHLIGRQDELSTLNAAYQSKSAEFIAVYGRRRVGKTYLIKAIAKQKEAIFFYISGTQDASMKDQISDFCDVLESTFYNNELEIKQPKNWKKAFESLTNIIKREAGTRKIILFFDELPWLASGRSRFVQALDYYWNRHWSDMPHIKLIVCGSAASWMIHHVVNHRGGLHNRLSGQIALSPFDLKETKAFLHSKSIQYTDNQILEIFMALGGIPYYLNFLKKNLSVAQNIDQLCFQNKGKLVDEFTQLYQSLFKHAESYEELIRIIASKRNGIERREILKKTKLSTDGGRLKERLDALEKSGFIVSFKPYGFIKRKTFYRIIDEYSLFYLSWIEPALDNLRKLDKTTGYWLDKYQSPAWRAWSGLAFESVCYKHIAQIRSALAIHASAMVGSWQYIPKKSSKETGAQIDLLFDRDDGVMTICEMKFTSQPYQLTKDEYQLLERKIAVFKKQSKTEKQIQVAFITNSPIKQTLYSEEMIAYNVVLQDLLR